MPAQETPETPHRVSTRDLGDRFFKLLEEANGLQDSINGVRVDIEVIGQDAKEARSRVDQLAHQLTSLRTAITVTLDELEARLPVPTNGEAPLRK